MDGLWQLNYQTLRNNFLSMKTIFDVVFSVAALIVLSPAFLIISLIVKTTSPGKVFYRGVRAGKDNVNFRIYKFRTMVQDAEKAGVQWTIDKDVRVTKVGNILRKTRVDELPQLWNVIRGDMSFIGPRPERPEFVMTLEKEIPHYQIRHLVRPGLSGWAQINQPTGDASVKESTEKLQYDLYYIKNRSLVFDLDILARTIMVVLRRQGH